MRKFEEFKAIIDEEEMAGRNHTYILFEEIQAITAEATEKIVEPLVEKGDETWMEYDSVLGKMAEKYATAGFINGYKAAMRLLREAALI